ncbi:MAG: tRNA (adenosine(37)-N6)-dimethylallyltransferase MiaA [Candidatus Doudnabacteria bacterium]|nr:tRNA (adenosine(37)-N6)-dimethylallyltransferase MiaA [Candidatus Doudnabacteria bacterium]
MSSRPPSPYSLVVILGPTASGKSSLAIKLARKFSGEIISADSRQVYKGMDIGTGKITRQERKLVPHYLLDVASPKKQFTVSDFKKLGVEAIEKIQKKHKVPFIVGGTAFYIYSLIDNLNIPEVKPNIQLRKELVKKSPAQLFAMLKKLDPARAKTIDPKNPARLIRAIEIIKSTGKPVPSLSSLPPSPFPLLLGIRKDQNELYKLIDKRLEQRLKAGMITEVKKLKKSGLTWKRLESFGLEYCFVALHLQGLITYEEMTEQLKNAIHHFSKRQMTWFKRDSRIHWVKNQKEAEKLIRNYLQNS